jgi:hypothetical protein
MASIADMIIRIDAKIYALINDVDDITSYTLGEKSVKKTEALRALTELRASYADLAEREPYEDIRGIAWDVSEFGEEEAEFIGDEN